MRLLINTLFSIIIIFCGFSSCDIKERNPHVLFKINNIELKKQIKEYGLTKYRKGDLGYLIVGIRTLPGQNITEYYLNYESDTHAVEIEGDLFIMDCDDFITLGYYFNSSLISTKEGYIWDYFKIFFPKKYCDYLQGSISMPATGLSETCILTFKDGKMINKEIKLE